MHPWLTQRPGTSEKYERFEGKKEISLLPCYLPDAFQLSAQTSTRMLLLLYSVQTGDGKASGGNLSVYWRIQSTFETINNHESRTLGDYSRRDGFPTRKQSLHRHQLDHIPNMLE